MKKRMVFGQWAGAQVVLHDVTPEPGNRPYCCWLLRQVMGVFKLYEVERMPPKPLLFFGEDAWTRLSKELLLDHDCSEVLRCGVFLERLTLQVKAWQAEAEVWRVQREAADLLSRSIPVRTQGSVAGPPS